MKLLAASLFCGIVFGFGLAMSGMTDIARVIGFFDIFGNWDPTLMFVMGGALMVSLPFFQLGLGRLKAPVFSDMFRLPTRRDIDVRLVSGAALFGIGWGMVGLCPGPAFAALSYMNLDILIFTVAMMAGMFVVDLVDNLVTGEQASA
ncbi:MAG: YeeE/YedE family protein [Proteobacteria bacterium]|nr:YeeE/YedE family protein [Pseudomonadota bacterium]